MTDLATNPETPEVETEGVETLETEQPEVEGEESQAAPPEPETEEVEHEGQKYHIPKALKPALLMQADYTRKTQGVAEQRRQWEERASALQAQEKAQSEHLTDIAKVVALNDALAQFEKADWPAIRAKDAGVAQDLWLQYQQTRDARDKAVQALQQKVSEKQLETQRETAKRIEEGRAQLARDIKDWSPELAGKLNSFATSEFGFTAQELGQVSDPRIVRLLHAAYLGKQSQTKQAATKTAAVAQAAKPLPTVAGNAGTKKGLSDELSAEEWVRRRNEQLRRRR